MSYFVVWGVSHTLAAARRGRRVHLALVSFNITDGGVIK